MKLVFTSRFEKDLLSIRDKAVKANVLAALVRLKRASRLDEAGDITKLKGSKNAFRLKVGNFRIGFYLTADTITLTLGRFVDRKDIYRLFP